MADVKDNWELLGRLVKPRISAKQAKQSAELLLKLGFLKKNGDRYEQTEPVVSTGFGAHAHQIVKFQMEMLRNAIAAFDNCNERQRLTSSTTLGISGELYPQFISMIREFRLQLMEMARNDNNSDMVYQFNLNLFPVSEPIHRAKGAS